MENSVCESSLLFGKCLGLSVLEAIILIYSSKQAQKCKLKVSLALYQLKMYIL